MKKQKEKNRYQKLFLVGLLTTFVIWIVAGQICLNFNISQTIKYSPLMEGIMIIFMNTTWVFLMPVIWLSSFVRPFVGTTISVYLLNGVALVYLGLVTKIAYILGKKLLRLH